MLFEASPVYNEYYIIRDKTILGSVTVLSVLYIRSGKEKYRTVVSYSLKDKSYEKLIMAGDDIALLKKGEAFFGGYPDTMKKEIIRYRRTDPYRN